MQDRMTVEQEVCIMTDKEWWNICVNVISINLIIHMFLTLKTNLPIGQYSMKNSAIQQISINIITIWCPEIAKTHFEIISYFMSSQIIPNHAC